MPVKKQLENNRRHLSGLGDLSKSFNNNNHHHQQHHLYRTINDNDNNDININNDKDSTANILRKMLSV